VANCSNFSNAPAVSLLARLQSLIVSRDGSHLSIGGSSCLETVGYAISRLLPCWLRRAPPWGRIPALYRELLCQAVFPGLSGKW